MMKSIMLLGIGLIGTQGCLAANAAEIMQPRVKVTGIDDPEISQHFYDMLTGDVMVSEESDLTITDSGLDRFLVFDTGEEIQVHLLVKDGEGGYVTGLHFATSLDSSLADGEEVELLTRVISFDDGALNRSMRINAIRQSYDSGESLTSIAFEQAKLQSSGSSGPIALAMPIEVDCAAAGPNTICCGFSRGHQIRIICVCNNGSNNWSVCFDSNWS